MGFVRLGTLSAEALERILRSSNANDRKARLALVRGKAGSDRIAGRDCPSGAASVREQVRTKIV